MLAKAGAAALGILALLLAWLGFAVFTRGHSYEEDIAGAVCLLASAVLVAAAYLGLVLDARPGRDT